MTSSDGQMVRRALGPGTSQEMEGSASAKTGHNVVSGYRTAQVNITVLQQGIKSEDVLALPTYLGSLLSRPATSALNDSAVDIRDVLSPQNYRSFRHECFPHLTASEHTRSPAKNAPKVIDLLELRHKSILYAWRECSDSRVLWVDGCLSRSGRDWMTDLAWETIRSAKATQATTAHYFFPVDQQDLTPEIVLQDLIFQVIRAHSKKFNQMKCLKSGLVKARFRSAANSCNDLWDLLWQCMTVAEIETLLIVLDRVDTLYAACEAQGRPLDQVHTFVDQLHNLVAKTEIQITIKVLMTARFPTTTNSLTIPSSDRWAILRIPKPPLRHPRHAKTAGRSRASIQGKPLAVRRKTNELQNSGTDSEDDDMSIENKERTTMVPSDGGMDSLDDTESEPWDEADLTQDLAESSAESDLETKGSTRRELPAVTPNISISKKKDHSSGYESSGSDDLRQPVDLSKELRDSNGDDESSADESPFAQSPPEFKVELCTSSKFQSASLSSDSEID